MNELINNESNDHGQMYDKKTDICGKKEWKKKGNENNLTFILQ
jgi:hypothetical protein